MKPRNVVVMLALVLLCVVGFFVIKGKETGGDGDGKLLPPYWPKFTKPDATALSVRGQGEELKIRRRPESSDRWDVIEGAEFVRADGNAVDDLLTALSRQSVSARYKADTVGAGDLKGYGLDKPTIAVEVTISGAPQLVRYGKLTREGNKVYADGGAGTDVWVVPKDAMELAIADVVSRVRDKRLFDSTAFNVAKLEIVKEGVTVAEVSRDVEQVWHVTQPFKGYANPTKFEYDLSRIVNVEVERWEEFGAGDLEKYGLAKPRFEVRVTPKGEGKKTEALLVGAETDGGGCFVSEQGTKTVARVGKAFCEAVTKDTPDTYRDNSFTRLGNAGTGVEVKVGDVAYRLEKPASTWDVVIGQERRPGDGAKIGRLLTKLREWATVEFLDTADPKEMGLTDADYVQIERESGGKSDASKITLLIGKAGPDDASVYAMRKGDGGVERVDAAPLNEMLKGPTQYFRNESLVWKTELIESLTRDSGLEGEGGAVEVTTIARDLSAADKSWHWVGGGNVGNIDAKALNELLETVNTLRARDWLPFQPEKDNERMGFRPPKAATMTLSAHLTSQGPTDADPKLYVGKRRPEGGYFARYVEGNGKATTWAFVLDEDKVKTLMAPLGAK